MSTLAQSLQLNESEPNKPWTSSHTDKNFLPNANLSGRTVKHRSGFTRLYEMPPISKGSKILGTSFPISTSFIFPLASSFAPTTIPIRLLKLQRKRAQLTTLHSHDLQPTPISLTIVTSVYRPFNMMSSRFARPALTAVTRQTASRTAVRTYAAAASTVDSKPPVALFGLDGTYANALVRMSFSFH